MNKKKIAVLLIAGTLTIGVVGATFAWFTSNDSVTNKFSTGSVTDPETPGNPDAGIEIEENFPDSTDGKYNKPVLPGTKMTKEVRVESTANYDQYLRAKVTKTWYDKENKVVTHYNKTNEGGKEQIEYGIPTSGDGKVWIELDSALIVLEFAPSATVIGDTWSPVATDGYYYYNQLLAKYPAKTSDLLKAVTLNKEASNYYKNLTFDVKIDAESVQATQDAVGGWANIPTDVKGLGK